MTTIKEFLSKLGYNTVSDEMYSYIKEWEDWYEGFVKDFHQYTVYNGVQAVTKERARLNMAKTVCEDWASLILNEKVKFHTDTKFDKELDHVFEYNNFSVKANQLIELAFAFGTGALVEYMDAAGEVVIDYIRAGMIYPLSWENGYINECAFGSMRETAEGSQIYIQVHVLKKGKYVIQNYLIDAETGEEIQDDTILPEVPTKSDKPLFQLISPNIVNNIDLDSPLGISVYANAISQVQGCDLVYDSYMNEFALGRRRVLVPLSMAKVKMSETGVVKPVFDPNDTTFYAVPDSPNQKIEPMDMSIRASEHELGITKALDLLSFKCGMGTGRYRFENGAVKTATEVISAKSDLYQSLRKHEIIVGAAISGMVDRIAFLKDKKLKEAVQIDFDDSIIEDKQAERRQDMTDVNMGVMQLWEYRMKWYGEDAETAKKMVGQDADVLEDDLPVKK